MTAKTAGMQRIPAVLLCFSDGFDAILQHFDKAVAVNIQNNGGVFSSNCLSL